MLALRQLENHLATEFFKYVPIRPDEKSKRKPEEIEMFKRTRGLVAYFLKNIGNCSDDKISKHIVDGFGDNGIDGILYDPMEKALHILQAKWISNGNDGIDLGDINKFITGIKDIIKPSFERFNDEIKGLSGEVNAALLDINTRVVVTVIATTQQPFSKEGQQVIDDLLTEQNVVSPFMSFEYWDIKRIYDYLKEGAHENPIDTDLLLTNWTDIQEPAKAVVGLISGSDLAGLYTKNGKRLLSPNIRYFLGKTEVNDSIISTARNNPELFWYYNNGVTAITKSISKKPIGGSSHATGLFECKGLFIVNGAQTVGSLCEAQKTGVDISKISVGLRVIEVPADKDEFGVAVTRSNNTQNRVDSRDFVSLDKNQERIYEEMLLENVIYAFKAGDVVPDGMDGFSFEEAAISQACFKNDVALMVITKREVSRLWANTDKAPYKLLFNSSTEGPKIWQLIKIMRKVEAWINKNSKITSDNRERLIMVHGNRYILMLVYLDLVKQGYKIDINDIPEGDVFTSCNKCYADLSQTINSHYSDAQLGTLFKNQQKCSDIADKIRVM